MGTGAAMVEYTLVDRRAARMSKRMVEVLNDEVAIFEDKVFAMRDNCGFFVGGR